MASAEATKKTQQIADAALDRNAADLVAFDVSELTSYADVMFIATGRSDRQVRAIAESIDERLHREGERALGVEGIDSGRWVLLDCDDVIVHVFDEDTRSAYALERLWSDAPRVTLDVPAEAQLEEPVPVPDAPHSPSEARPKAASE